MYLESLVHGESTSLDPFKIFCFFLTFDNLIIMIVNLFGFNLKGAPCCSRICMYIFLPKFGKFSPIMPKIASCCFVFLFLWDSQNACFFLLLSFESCKFSCLFCSFCSQSLTQKFQIISLLIHQFFSFVWLSLTLNLSSLAAISSSKICVCVCVCERDRKK